MKIQTVWAVYFSATGVTDRVVNTLAEELAGKLGAPVERVSFTRPAERERERSFREGDLVVVGSPTYAGRVPNKIRPDFRDKLRGNGALAVPVVTFGNRAYENSLAELCALLEEGGFHTVGAGAFVGQHAFTDQLGFGRPGWSDQFEIREFAGSLARKVGELTAPPPPVRVPGDPAAPYYVPKGTDGKPVDFLRAKPKTHLAKCNGCGACARLCPMGAIDLRDTSKVTGTCIKCQRCVVKCTKRAKYFDDPAMMSHVAMLEASFREMAENETFL